MDPNIAKATKLNSHEDATSPQSTKNGSNEKQMDPQL